jgi:hypothetical protein
VQYTLITDIWKGKENKMNKTIQETENSWKRSRKKGKRELIDSMEQSSS